MHVTPSLSFQIMIVIQQMSVYDFTGQHHKIAIVMVVSGKLNKVDGRAIVLAAMCSFGFVLRGGFSTETLSLLKRWFYTVMKSRYMTFRTVVLRRSECMRDKEREVYILLQRLITR